MKVFLSYAHTDKTLAKKVADGLKRAGFDVWENFNEIIPGENWADKTAQALSESEAMVVLLTPDSLNSPYVMSEFNYALGNKTYKGRLIPVVIGSPDSLPEEKLPWIIKNLQTIRLPKRGKQDEGIKRIAETLRNAA
jgi:hypothetical protein